MGMEAIFLHSGSVCRAGDIVVQNRNGVGQERRIKAKAEKPENPVLLLDPTGAGFLHGWCL